MRLAHQFRFRRRVLEPHQDDMNCIQYAHAPPPLHPARLVNSARERHNYHTMDTLLIATQNRHKITEITPLLEGLDVRLLTLADAAPQLDIPETGATFLENARLKALAAAGATGLLTLADDSGLAVDALHGAPGVHSRRFAGSDADRIARVLSLLGDLPAERRTARFHCAVVIAEPDDVLEEIDETVEGHMTMSPRGNAGFGYDPIFQPLGFSRTMAEMRLEEKNAISHRGKAFRRAAVFLYGWFGPHQPGAKA